MRIFPKSLVGLLLFSAVFCQSLHAFCPRCEKIEADRKEEQVKYPQKAGYYDDQIKIHQKNKSETGTESQKHESVLSLLEKSDSRSNNREGIDTGYASNYAFSTLYTIFKTRDFLETLGDSFTLFLPTNEAFKQLSDRILVDLTLPANQEQLAALVSNHIAAKKVLKTDFDNQEDLTIKAISGKNITLKNANGRSTANNAQILRVEPAGHDGVIYIIDRVLTP